MSVTSAVIEGAKQKSTGGAAVAALLWPVHQRPEGQFRDEAWLNTQPVATILQMKEVFEKMQKDTNTDSGMHRDSKPAPITVKRCVDDCFTALSQARFDLRMPLSDWSTWWPRMPVERVERYKTLDLKVVGAESQISKSAINRMHDRAAPKQLKFFHKKNLNVARNPLKEHRLRDGDSVYTSSEFNWAEVDDVKHLVDAIINFGIVSQSLWPYDQTPWILLKLYNTYGWMQYGIQEKKRVSIICDHFDRVAAANADRAVGRLPPCDYLEQERILKMILTEEGLSQSPPVTAGGFGQEVSGFKGSTGGGQRGGQQGRGRGSGRGGRGGRYGGNDGNRPLAVCPNGRQICFNFNKPGGCTFAPSTKGSGCKGANGQRDYAHVCSYYDTNTKQYCLKGHPKHQH